MEPVLGANADPDTETPSHSREVALQHMANSIPFLQLLLLWYLGGVLCVASTKTLLMGEDAISPAALSMFQFLCTILPLNYALHGHTLWRGVPLSLPKHKLQDDKAKKLTMCALFYSTGFVLTSVSFYTSSASFTETIKAAEPLTSSAVAVLYNLDSVPFKEMLSLALIVIGVLLTTKGAHSGSGVPAAAKTQDDFLSTIVTLAANLCFSFRGAYQTMLKKPISNSNGVGSLPKTITDFQLFLRISHFGFFLSFALVLLCDIIWPILANRSESTLTTLSHLVVKIGRSFPILIINGICHGIYNQASTVMLSRLSLVHHAALNCARRLFAIVVTSIYFRVPFTTSGVLGVTLTLLGFGIYSNLKARRKLRGLKDVVHGGQNLPTSESGKPERRNRIRGPFSNNSNV
ncbi:hypothetical protein TrLO_g2389 [Triparma laevis f. longispina]|uniref:Sugar phosphate transporter domain-containing protein n=1 Tax=Triparma laevis f. longispina TaxID=1714387 RepID=A0A9W7KY88_9STRA|nr:hypothetical protein TrLO_g2389 [Triparma laevis f. longispina]